MVAPASLFPAYSLLARRQCPAAKGGDPVTVSLPCTNPGFFPLCQYTSKLLSCKVTSEVLFNLSVWVLMHARSRCTLSWFAVPCCVQ